MNQKSTLVLGASLNPSKYSNRAVQMLNEKGFKVLAFGLREGQIGEIKVSSDLSGIKNIHTVTLYMNANNQKSYEEFIQNLDPTRVIFNPGTENPEFEIQLKNKGIEVINGCTLVMLSIGNF